MFHFFFCQNFLSRYLRINHCNWSLASGSDKTNTSVFTYLVWVLRPSVLMRMSKWKFSQEAKQTGKESLRLLLKSSFLLILWYLNKIVTGFNSTLRQGNITHHEYIQVCFCLSFFFLAGSYSSYLSLGPIFIFLRFCYLMQVGKGRDVGLNQIALFEGKVAGGNGEQVLSRDIYRLGQLFDFFRMLSFFFTTVGYYVCTMVCLLMILSIVILNLPVFRFVWY